MPMHLFRLAIAGLLAALCSCTIDLPIDSANGSGSSDGTATGSPTSTGSTGDADSSYSASSTGESTAGASPCGLGWERPFVYGEAGVDLELTNATRDPTGALILVGKRSDGRSFVLKLDAATGEPSWKAPVRVDGILTDVAAGPTGIYVAGFKQVAGDNTDSLLAWLSDDGESLEEQNGGVPGTSNDKVYALTVTADGRVATTGYCAKGRQLLVGLRDSGLTGNAFTCLPSSAVDIRGWDIVETMNGFMLAGQWSGTLDLSPVPLEAPTPAQGNFLAFLNADGGPTKYVTLASLGSTRVDPAEYSHLPAVYLAPGPGGTILAAGRAAEGGCAAGCRPAVAMFDGTGAPIGAPQTLTNEAGVVTGIAVDATAGVFVSGALKAGSYTGEGEARSGVAFGAWRDLELAFVRNWTMTCPDNGACSSAEAILLDPAREVVFWAGSLASTEAVSWADDDDTTVDPVITPAVSGVSNVFVVAQCRLSAHHLSRSR